MKRKIYKFEKRRESAASRLLFSPCASPCSGVSLISMLWSRPRGKAEDAPAEDAGEEGGWL